MPPAKPTPPAKLALVVSYFHTTRVAHSIKDLEKALPSAAGISSMAVKDALAELVGESLIRVEKIGSGNWYWSFPADAALSKRAELEKASAEREKVLAAVQELGTQIEAETEKAELEGDDKAGLVLRLRERAQVRSKLEAELSEWDGAGVLEKMERDIKQLVERTNRFIDNLYALESYYKELSGGDAESMAGMRAMFGIEEEMEYLEAHL